jgi:DNA-directed RNA polymerase subunit RPC12/RpoP
MEEGFKPGIYEVEGFCSDACFYQFWYKVQEYPMDEVGTDIAEFSGKIIWLWNQAILNAVANANPYVAKDLVPKVNNAIRLQSQRYPAIPWWDSTGKPLWTYRNFHDKAKSTLAQNLERCGRVQDAAKIFEELRMYDKARELRERDRHIIVKKTDVSVNLNILLQQVKDGGIVAIFRCPHCGGKLKIDNKTTLNSLKVCEYCNSEIDTMDLADFLKTVLT